MASKKQKPVKILVLQRGWVVVGYVEKDGEELVIEKGAVIRRWGTTKGLGELAASGPLEGTQLDPAPTMRAHELTVVLSMDCEAEKWTAKLS